MPAEYVSTPVAEESLASSEGTAEVIERLIVNVLKARDLYTRLVALVPLSDDVRDRIIDLTLANGELYDLCNEKAAAVARGEKDARYLLVLIERDLALCRSRAMIRADLNRRLGGEASGESVKSYGTGAGG